MKLSAGLLTCVAAGPTVTCNKGDDAVMTAKLLDADVQIDLTTVGWTKVTGGYEKEYVPTAADVSEVTLDKDANDPSKGTYRALQFSNSVDSNGCETKTVGGVTVCVKTGHEYTFTCNYDLSDQDLTEQPFTVSGSDTVDSATNTGSLTYTLTVDKSTAYTIGDKVTATITPATSGLVHATIASCEVRNTVKSETVGLIGADLAPVTEVGTAISTGSGTGALGFSWSSFKWSTSKTTSGADSPDEDQELHCSISLSTCEHGWERFEIDGKSKCFKNFGVHARGGAATVCTDAGAALPLPRNAKAQTDYATAFKAMDGNMSRVAIGTSDAAKEGSWVNKSGEEITFTAWHEPSEEPNNGSGLEHYGEMVLTWPDSGNWNDLSTFYRLPIVCEK